MKADIPPKRLSHPDLPRLPDPLEATYPSVRLYRAGSWSVFELGGEFDLLAVPLVRTLPPADASRVVFDLRAVTFMDCGGLSALVSIWRTAQSVGGCVRVVVASRQLRKLLTLTRVDRMVPLFDTLEDALSAPVAPPPAAIA